VAFGLTNIYLPSRCGSALSFQPCSRSGRLAQRRRRSRSEAPDDRRPEARQGGCPLAICAMTSGVASA
jgi:hypothetical protein